MRYRRLAIALWIAFAFVTWNVVFDRGVGDAAVEFSRDQIVRHQQGAPVVSIDTAFRPRVRHAALIASAWTGLVLVCGVLALALSGEGRGRNRGTEVPRYSNVSGPRSTRRAGR